MSYPKSCLKRSSISSTNSDAISLSPRAPSCFPPGLALTQSGGSTISTGSSLSPSASSSSSSSGAGSAPKARRKSVSFCEDHDIRVYYPPPAPLRKQAKRAATRLFRACADALRIDSPYDMSQGSPFFDRPGEMEPWP